jgi:hypothetical protein
MTVNEKRIVDPVELDCPAPWRFDHSWMTEDGRRVSPDFVEVVEPPQFNLLSGCTERDSESGR